MSVPQWHVIPYHQYLFRVLAAVILMTAPLVVADAQGVGSSRGLPLTAAGRHTIKGRVYFPSDRPADKHVKVKLESANTFGAFSTVTDEDGLFRFNQLEAGAYTIVVEADKAYEIARELVNIAREASPGGRIVDVPIYLKLKSTDATLAAVPKPALNLYKKAQDSIQAGDGKTAIEHLKGAVAIYGNFSQAFNELGVQYLKLGQIDDAADALKNAVKLAPGDFQPRLNYGIALLNQKKYAESEEQLRAALKKNATSSTAHMYLGMALMNQKQLAEAQKELEIAVSSNSSEVGVAHKYLGGIYWGMRDYKRAADELEIYLKLMPKAADAERTRAAIKDLRSK